MANVSRQKTSHTKYSSYLLRKQLKTTATVFYLECQIHPHSCRCCNSGPAFAIRHQPSEICLRQIDLFRVILTQIMGNTRLVDKSLMVCRGEIVELSLLSHELLGMPTSTPHKWGCSRKSSSLGVQQSCENTAGIVVRFGIESERYHRDRH